MKNKTSKGRFLKGQTAMLFALALPTLLGAIAMCTDTLLMYVNWEYLQKAVDAAALAGANYLPNDQPDAIAVANSYAKRNGLLDAEVTPSVSADGTTITVNASRTVPYFFGKVLGLTTQKISVSASASAASGLDCIGCGNEGTTPTSLGTPPSGSTFTPTAGSSIGQYPLVPIGLDVNTPYVLNQALTLHNIELGPGNWDTLAYGGTGASNLGVNLANGYSGPIRKGDSVTTEPGMMMGPVMDALNNRIAASAPDATFSYHSPTDSRIMFLPLVDWSGFPDGRTSMPVLGFAAVWLDSVSGGDINVHFITAVAPESLANSSAPSYGVLAPPVLLK